MTDIFGDYAGNCGECIHYKETFCDCCISDHYMHSLEEEHPACMTYEED
jgi:hypothetical protein